MPGKGALWKNPFDFALYRLHVWHAKPRTILEIGSKHGGSALWLADTLQLYGVDGRVVSVDINPVRSSRIRASIFGRRCGQSWGHPHAGISRPVAQAVDGDRRFEPPVRTHTGGAALPSPAAAALVSF
ncbi:MAG: CmcI family methyltransferase [Tepidimonas sp.]|uniref:CmcI family methyltransferase n=1 Tax=Tepidimonas sp. TaxID=2002775 RepID=UPI004054DD33